MRSALVMFLATLLGVVAGCSSQKKTESHDDTPPRVQLPIDPDNPPQAIGWWSNGREIACVDQSGLYVVLPYPDPNALPVQYGRWSRESYAFIWLEPYNTLTYAPARASFKRSAGEVTLTFPQLAPMTLTDNVGNVRWPDPG